MPVTAVLRGGPANGRRITIDLDTAPPVIEYTFGRRTVVYEKTDGAGTHGIVYRPNTLIDRVTTDLTPTPAQPPATPTPATKKPRKAAKPKATSFSG